MRDLGMAVSIDGIGNVVATYAGADPAAARRDDRLAHRHRRDRRPLRRQPRRARRARGGRDAGGAGVELPRAVQVAFFTDEEGARFPPDMLGSLVYVGGLGARGGTRRPCRPTAAGSATNSPGSATPGSTPCPAAAFPAAFVELHIEQGPVLEDEGVDDRGRHRRAGDLLERVHRDRAVGPRRHDADAPAQGPDGRGRPRDHRGARRDGWVGRHPGRDRRSHRRLPEPHQRGGPTGPVHARRAEHRRVGAATTSKRTCSPSPRRRRREGCTITRRELARFEPVDFDRGDDRPRRSDCRPTRLLDEADAVGGRARRADARSGLSHEHDLRAERRRARHNLAEHTDPADIEAGANVLLQVVIARATRSEHSSLRCPKRSDFCTPLVQKSDTFEVAGGLRGCRQLGGGRPGRCRRLATRRWGRVGRLRGRRGWRASSRRSPSSASWVRNAWWAVMSTLGNVSRRANTSSVMTSLERSSKKSVGLLLVDVERERADPAALEPVDRRRRCRSSAPRPVLTSITPGFMRAIVVGGDEVMGLGGERAVER